jgi:hypothetical protein
VSSIEHAGKRDIDGQTRVIEMSGSTRVNAFSV